MYLFISFLGGEESGSAVAILRLSRLSQLDVVCELIKKRGVRS